VRSNAAAGATFSAAVGCDALENYGFLSGAWPFGVVELIWAAVAVRRYRATATA
jgi:hypothetical protein